MKIVHVFFDAGPYGIRTFLINLLRYQKINVKDFEVAIAFHAEHKDMNKLIETGVSFHCLHRKSAKDIRLVFGFLKIFKDYDIVNLHTHSPWALLAAWISRKKILYTFHGAFGFRRKFVDSVLKIYYRAILNKFCTRITFASETSLSIYLEKTKSKIREDKIELFPYGLDVKHIIPSKTRESSRRSLNLDGKFVVGTASRMDPVKRIERLIEVFFDLPNKTNLALLIVGSGDEDYQKYLIDLVNDFQLQDKVFFLGYREDVIDIINSFDFFVLPSKDETFGLALLEAMALGVPSAIFEDGGAMVKILGNSGFIVRSKKELGEVIIRVKENEMLREETAKKVKKQALEFDIRHTSDNFYRIYKELTDE